MARVSPTLIRTLTVLGVVVVLIGLGSQLRASLGLDLSVESLRTFAEGLGPAAPLLFVGVVALRSFLALPSQVVLIAAGLCFGTVLGAIVGGVGLMLSGFAIFLGARYAGRESVEAKVGTRFRGLMDATEGPGAAVAIALGSGYPISPLSPIHATAGLSLITVPLFLSGAFGGGLIRAGIFSYFGNAILEEGVGQIAIAATALAVLLALPLLFPSGRQWLARLFGRGAASSPDEAGQPMPAAAEAESRPEPEEPT